MKYRSIRKQLHAQAVVAKRARLQQQLQDAESASHSRNPGMLYQVLRRIAPKIRRRRMQLRDDDHKLAGPEKEPTLVIQHFADVFAAQQATAGFTLRETFSFTAEEFTQYFARTPGTQGPPGTLCSRTFVEMVLRGGRGSNHTVPRRLSSARVVRRTMACRLECVVSLSAAQN